MCRGRCAALRRVAPRRAARQQSDAVTERSLRAQAHREALESAERAAAAEGRAATSPSVQFFVWEWLRAVYATEGAVRMAAYTLFEALEAAASGGRSHMVKLLRGVLAGSSGEAAWRYTLQMRRVVGSLPLREVSSRPRASNDRGVL